jgi:hypothetical protein
MTKLRKRRVATTHGGAPNGKGLSISLKPNPKGEVFYYNKIITNYLKKGGGNER